MLGNTDRSGQILRAGNLIWEHRREQIFRTHSLNRRRYFLASLEPQNRQRPRRIPTPSNTEHRSVEQSLRQHIANGLRREKLEHELQRERMSVTQGNENAVVRG